MRNEVLRIRKKLGLNQDQFAVKLGVTPMTIRRWESGKTSPSPMARRLLEEIKKDGKSAIRQTVRKE